MKRSIQFLFTSLSALGLFIGSCAAPPPPAAAVQSTPSSDAASSDAASLGSGKGTGADSAPLTLDGATLGTDTAKAAMVVCATRGMFFDRAAVKDQCTTFPVAKDSCTLNAKQFKDYKDTSSKFPGFKLDQCLDCTTPASVAPCSVMPKQQDKPGTRLFWVKYTNDKDALGGITSQSLYLPK